MDRADLEGATAAARYFLELYPYAYNTGDLAAWKAMSHPDCIFCASVVERVEALHAQGGYETGGDVVWLEVTARPGADGAVEIDAEVRQSPTFETTASGTVEVSSGGEGTVYVDLQWREDWLIRGVDASGGVDS